MKQTLKQVLVLKQRYCEMWRDKPDEYWYARTAEEMLELSLALRNQHEHTPDTELTQIASICLNWLEMRQDREIANAS